MTDETELEVLQDIRTGVGATNTALTELRGAIVDIRNKLAAVKVVKLYTGKNPTGVQGETHAEKTEKEFTDLWNDGYRVITTLGSDENWATLLMGKYKAPNTAK